MTAFRASSAPDAVRPQVETVPQAAEQAVGRIAGARLIRLQGLGHAPQVTVPDRFQATLLDVLASRGR